SSLMTTGARPARFYGIPKVHKAGVPLRPIAGAATERISWYLHHILQPLVPRKVTAYIQDTNHFLQWLRSLKDVPKGALFVTMDVCSLYPNIPTDEGIEAVKNFMQTNSEHMGQKLHFLLQLLKFVLTCNNIIHLDKHYLQVRGTAMGTRVAPTYANIFMHDLEQKVLSNSPYKPFAYKRYLDDIFMVWTHGEDALKEFIDFFNRYQDSGTIKLTYEYSDTSFTYLDVAGHILPSGTILTEVFKKSVARNSYLHYTSEHPKHLLNSIPYSQALRFKRICSNDASFEKQSKDMARDFVSREYPAHVVQAAVMRARSEPTTPKDRPEGEGSRPKLHLSIPYGRQLPKISRILQRHYHILQQSETVKAIFPSIPRVVYSTAPSLRKHLVRAQLPTSEYQSHSKGSSRPCLRTGKGRPCSLCNRMPVTEKIVSNHTGYGHYVKGSISCKTSNVIYALVCKACGVQYVGQTSTPLNIRVNNHLALIRRNNTDSSEPCGLVVKHFNEVHSAEDIQFVGLEQVSDKTFLSRREAYWIAELATDAPAGLNSKDELIRLAV
ncbi:MAG: GIY-YIG nuclease family protein, partial [Gammaproteobacteria bacterium]|nr:GIY-YIG nuclease family protein [Gammaproteobacteria bacterium]